MKILQVVHNYPPEFLGGVERVVGLLNAALRTLGHEVMVFCGSAAIGPSPKVVREECDGVAIVRVVRGPHYENPTDVADPTGDRAFEETIDSFRPDVIHVHHWANHGAAPVAIAARRRIPAVVSLHDYWTTCALYFRVPDGETFCGEIERAEVCLPCISARHPVEAEEALHGLSMRRATVAQELDLAAAIVVSSKDQATRLAALGDWPAERTRKFAIVPLGVSPADPIARTSTASGVFRIAHWGNLSRVKGVHVLAAAAARAQGAANIRLRFIGRVLEAGLEDELRALAAPATVECVGAYRPENLASHLVDCDAAAFPSLAYETHSMVADEAIAFGLPVLVGDRGAVAERIGARGIVAAAGDVSAWTRAIERMMRPEESAACRRAIADQPLPTFAEHAHGVEKIYKGVLHRPPIFPTYVPDFGRDRLEFRRRRLFDVHRLILALEHRRADLEAAVRGEAEALDRVRAGSPDLGEVIARLRNEKETS